MRNYGRARLGSLLLFNVLMLSAAGLEIKAQAVIEIRLQIPSRLDGETLRGGQTRTYAVELKQGQFVQALFLQQGIDLVINVEDSLGAQVTVVDRPNGSLGRESVSLIAKTTGRHRIKISSLQPTAIEGKYSLIIEPLRAARPEDESRIHAEHLVSEGERLRANGGREDTTAGIARFQQALAIWQALADRYEEAVTLYGIGWGLSSQAEYQKAVSSFSRSMSLMRGLHDNFGESQAVAGLAWAEMYLNQIESAERDFTRALELNSSLNNLRGQAICLHGLGWTSALLDQNQQALEYFTRSLVLRRQVNDVRGQALTLVGLGKVQSRLKQYATALTYLEEALKTLRRLGDRYAEADTISNIGWVHAGAGRFDEAIASFNSALALRRLVGDRTGEATTLFGLARANSDAGKPREALNNIHDALAIIESLRTRSAVAQLRSSFFASVQEYYEFAVDLFMRLHGKSASEGFAAAALEMTERAGNRGLLDLLTEANIDIRQGVSRELIDRERQLQEQLKAAADRKLLLMSGRHTDEQLRKATDEVDALNAQYQQIEADIREASPRYAALTQPVPLTVPQIQALLDPQTVLLKYALGEKRSFLWLVTNKEIESFELPPRAEIESRAREVYDLLISRNLIVVGEGPDHTKARHREDDDRLDAAGRELSDLLLRAVAPKLGSKRLVISADGALRHLPFGILTIADGSPSPSPRRLLIQEHEIVNIPSASALAMLRRDAVNPRSAEKTLAIFADPVFSQQDERLSPTAVSDSLPNRKALSSRFAGPSESVSERGVRTPSEQTVFLPRLFTSRWEAEQISALVPAKQRLVALDFRANRGLAMSDELNNYRLLHFATHAIIDDNNPELSGIVLSQVDPRGRPVDGFLRSYEIFNLKLSADLVVLSACRTGLGRSVKGEGLTGLTRAFMYARVPRLVVSLWAVNDKATSELMVRFYRNMLGAKRLPPAAALRGAQVEMLNDGRWRAPYFWSGFVLEGDWK